jgi:hypothetical protein
MVIFLLRVYGLDERQKSKGSWNKSEIMWPGFRIRDLMFLHENSLTAW